MCVCVWLFLVVVVVVFIFGFPYLTILNYVNIYCKGGFAFPMFAVSKHCWCCCFFLCGNFGFVYWFWMLFCGLISCTIIHINYTYTPPRISPNRMNNTRTHRLSLPNKNLFIFFPSLFHPSTLNLYCQTFLLHFQIDHTSPSSMQSFQ